MGEELDFQSLVDSDMLEDVVEEGKNFADFWPLRLITVEYKRKCMICNTKRDDHDAENCPVCSNPYLFFHKTY